MKPKKYKCKSCGNLYEKKHSFQTWCSYDCGVNIAKNKLEKQNKSKAIQEKKEWKERKESLKRELNYSKDPLQIAINKIVRLIDKHQPCIARPFENCKFFDAGHVYSTGSHPALKYNLWNIHKQSVKSNRDKGGEQHLMLEGIEIRYGKERLNYIMELPKFHPVLKLSENEKKEALRKANQIIREMELGMAYTRDEVNEFLNIYKYKL